MGATGGEAKRREVERVRGGLVQSLHDRAGRREEARINDGCNARARNVAEPPKGGTVGQVQLSGWRRRAHVSTPE